MCKLSRDRVKIIGGRYRISAVAGATGWQSVDTPFSLSPPQGVRPRAFLRIENAKNRRFLGATQFAGVENKYCVYWLEWMLADAGPNDRVFQSNDAKLREMVEAGNQFLGF